MTDYSNEPGRIDLRAIEDASRPPDVDRVIAGALERSTGFPRQPQPEILASVEAYWRPVLAAAAILLVVATGSLAVTTRRSTDADPDAVLADWAQSNHVPTNEELLIAFQGYGR